MSKFFNKLSNLKIFFILFFVIFLLHADIIFAPLNTYFSGLYLKDLNYFINIRQYAINCLLNGIFPLWTTKIFCGMPFFANSETAIFYPLNFIFFVLPISKAINFSFILHFFILSFGVFLWIDNKIKDKFVSIIISLVAVFASSFYMHACAGHLSNIITAVWFPYLLYFYDKSFEDDSYKYIFPLTIIICLQIFAGHFQYTYYCALISLLYALFFCCNKKTICNIFISYFIALLLTSVQLLPSIEFYLEGARRTGILQSLSINSLPIYLLSVFFPKYTAFFHVFFWEISNYFGLFNILIVLITIFSFRKQNSIVKIVILSLLIYLMTYSFFSQSLGKLIPFFTSFRSSIKLIFFVNILLLPVLAIGIKSILDDEVRFNKYILIIISCLVIFCMFFRVNVNNFIISFINHNNISTHELEYSVFIFSMLIILFCFFVYFKRFFIFKLLLILLVVVQPIIFVRQYSIMKFFLKPDFKYNTADEININKDARFFSNNFYNLLDNEENISGSIPDVSKNYYEFINNLKFPFNEKNILGLLRCKCIVNDRDAKSFKKIEIDILKRINVFYDYKVEKNKGKIYEILSQKDFNVFDTIILEREPKYETKNKGEYKIGITYFDENSIEFNFHTTEPAIVLYTDNYSKGWTAYNIENTKEKYEIICADYIYKAISLQAGKHKIRIEYKPLSFIMGFWISFVSWMIFILSFLFFLYNKQKRITKQHKAK